MIEFKAIEKARPIVKAISDDVYKRRVALVTEIISPYRIPLLNKVNNYESVDLKVFFMAKTENRRDWSVDMDELEFAYEILSGFTIQRKHNNPYYLNSGVFRKLRQFDPKVVICGNYNSFAAFLALMYSRIYRKRFVLWCESTKNDVRRSRHVVELYKKIFVMLCDYYLVPGEASYEYLKILGANSQKIFFAPNSVDNDFFSSASQKAREHKQQFKLKKRYPAKIILYVGRMVRAKGIFDLIKAYERIKCVDVGLLFVGDGPDYSECRNYCKSNGVDNVFFEGFVGLKDLPVYYSVGDVLVLPSYSETWGLVLNEAMACGLPVIGTDITGAAKDLIHVGKNGYIYPKGNVDRLVACIKMILKEEKVTLRMGGESRAIIENYSPEKCAEGFVEVIEFAHT